MGGRGDQQREGRVQSLDVQYRNVSQSRNAVSIAEETEPELVEARSRPVVLICRSGNRTVLAAYTLQQMGYENVISLKTGLRGWNDYELPLVDIEEKPVDIEDADHYFVNKILKEQRNPASRGK